MKTSTLKKILSTVLGVMLLLTMIFVITSCQEEHVHTFGEDVTVTPATCDADGVAKRVCSDPECGYYEIYTVKAFGHDLQNHNGLAPTCVEDGYKAYITCKNCDYTNFCVEFILNEKGHSFKNATCTTPKTCKDCGLIEGEALGHTEGAVVIEKVKKASCTVDGHHDEVVYCSTCEKAGVKTELSRVTVTDPAFGHDIKERESKAPTCDTVGYEAHTYCATCRVKFNYVEIPALGHVAIVHPGQAATCTVDGWNEYETCEVCDYSNFNEMIIPAPGHTIVTLDGKAPTCTEPGYADYTECSVCGEECTKDLPENQLGATGHTAGEVGVENWFAPTCTAVGGWDDVVRCTVCNVILTSEHKEIAPLGHSYSDATGACVNGCGDRVSVGLSYILNADGQSFSVSGIGSCKDSEVIVPAFVNGLPVTAVADRAFEDVSSIVSIVLPDSVTSIGSGAFYWCKNLASVTFGAGLTDIGANAFNYCKALSTVNYRGTAAQFALINVASNNNSFKSAAVKFI